jgi:hypothetical protein
MMREVDWWPAPARAGPLRDERVGGGRDPSRSVALTGIMGARRAWTASMLSALSMPSR